MNRGDWARIGELAALQGLQGRDLPSFSNNVIAKRVVLADGVVVCGAVARIEVMTHLYIDRTWSTPAFRLAALELLQAEMRRELKEKGIEVAHAEISPRIERAFGRRLEKLGWEPCGWKQLVFRI